MSEQHQVVSASEEHAAEAPRGPALGLSRRRPARSPSSPYAHKFRMVTAALVGLAIGAIVVAIALLSTSDTAVTAAPWSAWKPSDSGTAGAQEIADHIAPLYRISPVDQLSVVTVVGLANSGSASAASSGATGSSTSSQGLQVAVRPSATSSAVSLLTGKTVAFNLCGIGGANCAIGVGVPSSARLLLLRREALELALYTFKYVGGVSNVVAILPPGRTSTTGAPGTLSPKSPLAKPATKPLNVALLFLHDELQPWLDRPLAQTLPEDFPPTVAQMRGAPEAGLVEQITARGLFSQALSQAQDGSNLIVLNPLPPE